MTRFRVSNGEPWRHPLAPPATRAGCIDGPRPCYRVRCRFHLLADVIAAELVNEAAGRPVAEPVADVEDLAASCALDAADAGPLTLLQVGELICVSRERIRQVEHDGLRKMRGRLPFLVGDAPLE
jgi:hypothetical protein